MRLVSFVWSEKGIAGLLTAAQDQIFPLDTIGYGDALSYLAAGCSCGAPLPRERRLLRQKNLFHWPVCGCSRHRRRPSLIYVCR